MAIDMAIIAVFSHGGGGDGGVSGAAGTIGEKGVAGVLGPGVAGPGVDGPGVDGPGTTGVTGTGVTGANGAARIIELLSRRTNSTNVTMPNFLTMICTSENLPKSRDLHVPSEHC